MLKILAQHISLLVGTAVDVGGRNIGFVSYGIEAAPVVTVILFAVKEVSLPAALKESGRSIVHVGVDPILTQFVSVVDNTQREFV